MHCTHPEQGQKHENSKNQNIRKYWKWRQLCWQTEFLALIVFTKKKITSLILRMAWESSIRDRKRFPSSFQNEIIYYYLEYALQFSTMKTYRRKWNVQINGDDFNKSAFISHGLLNRFSHKPLGICTAPGSFQSIMDVILPPAKWQFLLLHLDYIIIPFQSTDERKKHTRPVLSLLHKAGVTLNLRSASSSNEKSANWDI